MSEYCLVIKGTKQDGNRFRPGTPVPDLHWAYRFVDPWIEYDERGQVKGVPTGIQIVHDEDQIVLKITPEFCQRHEGAFEQLMELAKTNQLTYEFPCIDMCTMCEGHPACLYNDHKLGSCVEVPVAEVRR